MATPLQRKREEIDEQVRKRVGSDGVDRIVELLGDVRETEQRMAERLEEYYDAAQEHRRAVARAVDGGCRVSEVAKLKGVSRQRVRAMILDA